jgi:hypothetical protein
MPVCIHLSFAPGAVSGESTPILDRSRRRESHEQMYDILEERCDQRNGARHWPYTNGYYLRKLFPKVPARFRPATQAILSEIEYCNQASYVLVNHVQQRPHRETTSFTNCSHTGVSKISFLHPPPLSSPSCTASSARRASSCHNLTTLPGVYLPLKTPCLGASTPTRV